MASLPAESRSWPTEIDIHVLRSNPRGFNIYAHVPVLACIDLMALPFRTVGTYIP